MNVLLIIWLCILSALLLIIRRGERGGVFSLAYFLGISTIHVPGALMYLSSRNGLDGLDETRAGFQATLSGMTALVIGVWAGSRAPRSATKPIQVQGTNLQLAGLALCVTGIAIQFILMPLVSVVASVTAVFSAFAALIPLGLSMMVTSFMANNQIARVMMLMLSLPLLPGLTMIAMGFSSYGIYWIISVFSLAYTRSHSKLMLLALAPLAIFLGMSFGAAYFEGRNDLREAVWHQQSTVEQRIDRVTAMVVRLEPLDIHNPRHAQAFADRLNQNFLVGLGIERLETGAVELAKGSTLPWWSLIPRVLWPEKPIVGGGNTIVADFVGLEFGAGTSVGVGQVLEFFINFGWLGIVGGFLLLGFIFARLDLAFVSALNTRDLERLLLIGLPACALLQPGGNLLEIVVAVVGAWIAAKLLTLLLRRGLLASAAQVQ